MMILFLDFKASQSSQSRLKTAFLVVLRGSNRLWSDVKETFVKVSCRRLNRAISKGIEKEEWEALLDFVMSQDWTQ